MEKKFEELYKQYLSGQISQMDFELLKNNYIVSSKTSINNEKNTYKKKVCNQQRIN